MASRPDLVSVVAIDARRSHQPGGRVVPLIPPNRTWLIYSVQHCFSPSKRKLSCAQTPSNVISAWEVHKFLKWLSKPTHMLKCTQKCNARIAWIPTTTWYVCAFRYCRFHQLLFFSSKADHPNRDSWGASALAPTL